MTTTRLILRGLCFYWRAHLGVLLGTALGSLVLTGALLVGDSVRGSLRETALDRLGETRLALSAPERFCRAALADELASQLGVPVAPVLALRGSAALPDGSARAADVAVLGVDERFWQLGRGLAPTDATAPDEGRLNARLARQLGGLAEGAFVVRVEKPSALSRDVALTGDDDAVVALRLAAAGIAGDDAMGRFSLRAEQTPPHNVFLLLEALAGEMNLAGRANLLLVGGDCSTEVAERALRDSFRLEDSAHQLRWLEARGVLELGTDRVFIDPVVERAALEVVPSATRVLTYFVNEIAAGDRATPYSMVSALAPSPHAMDDDEIVINTWLAEDLSAAAGDRVRLRYFVLAPNRGLLEEEREFTVRSVVPPDPMDRDLAPAFPGLVDAESCRDWEPGFPIDLSRIRPRDEAYWDEYRGTPKAFVTLAAAESMWSNRYGRLTALRLPGNATLSEDIAARVDPALLGLYFTPVRERALAAGVEGVDFGGLFLGLSFFLIFSALLLTSLLFVFGAQQRSEEVGVLLALGWTPGQVRRLLLGEAALAAWLGAALGTLGGAAYTRGVLLGLSGIWQGAVGDAALRYHMRPASLAVGCLAGFAVALVAIAAVVHRQARVPARALLAPGAPFGPAPGAARRVRDRVIPWASALAGLAATALVAMAWQRGDTQSPATFFAAGSLLLLAGLGLARGALARSARLPQVRLDSVLALGFRGAALRPGRSLATVALLAAGSFLVVAVGANRHDPTTGSRLRSSGTGGFALVGRSSLPLYHDLNTRAGWDAYGLVGNDLAGMSVVAMRVRDGDDASCLNLNRAQVPRLLGVHPHEFARRAAFTLVQSEGDAGWELLGSPAPDGVIPAIGDQATVVWGLGASLGDTLPYTDGRGRRFELRIVGIIANSVLQGNLMVSEPRFRELFPDDSGYREFLIDAPPERARAISETLSRALVDQGLELTPAATRLREFAAVEHTYLAVFQALGGLGLLLGTLGLGIVVLRNVLERRSELALLLAVGWRRREVHALLIGEHALLLGAGIACGVVPALVAVLPALLSPGAGIPWVSLLFTLLLVAGSGVLAIVWSTRMALRGPLLAALGNE